jgi:hypothetical protein
VNFQAIELRLAKVARRPDVAGHDLGHVVLAT